MNFGHIWRIDGQVQVLVFAIFVPDNTQWDLLAKGVPTLKASIAGGAMRVSALHGCLSLWANSRSQFPYNRGQTCCDKLMQIRKGMFRDTLW